MTRKLNAEGELINKAKGCVGSCAEGVQKAEGLYG